MASKRKANLSSASGISFQSNTHSVIHKAKKPLSDFNQLRQAVKQLQRESAEQLSLECESQATFEFRSSQVNALKNAFNTLSDVVMEEVDGLRTEATKRWQNIERLLNTQEKKSKELQSEVSLARRTLEMWDLKERDWAKDNEILKVSHAHNAEWMQQMQHDIMQMRDQEAAFKQDQSAKVSQLTDETSNLRLKWDQQVESLNSKLREYDHALEKYKADLSSHKQQRTDDVETTEQAMNTVQNQQVRLRSFVDESIQAVGADNRGMKFQTDNIEATITGQKLDVADIKRNMLNHQRDLQNRFDHINRVFKVFSDALHISAPTIPVLTASSKTTTKETSVS